MGMANTLEGRLLDLRKRYVRTLPEKVALIAETLRQCEQGVPESWGELDRQFHTLAGTAGTYGLFGIAAAALDGEEVCAGFGGTAVDDGEVRYLRSLIDEIEGVVAHDLTVDPSTEAFFRSMYSGDSATDRPGVGLA
jgi:chemotaxis protein histidine kinase CheA